MEAFIIWAGMRKREKAVMKIGKKERKTERQTEKKKKKERKVRGKGK